MNQSEGRIEMSSKPGEGTRFHIHLPCAADPAEPAVVAPEDRGEETVLLVEDELPVRDLVAQVLRRRGYSLLKAVDGERRPWSWPAATPGPCTC